MSFLGLEWLYLAFHVYPYINWLALTKLVDPALLLACQPCADVIHRHHDQFAGTFHVDCATIVVGTS
jgi:hypothetical protein